MEKIVSAIIMMSIILTTTGCGNSKEPQSAANTQL